MPNPAESRDIRSCFFPVSQLTSRTLRKGLKIYNSPRIQPNPIIYRFLMIRGIRGLCGIGA